MVRREDGGVKGEGALYGIVPAISPLGWFFGLVYSLRRAETQPQVQQVLSGQVTDRLPERTKSVGDIPCFEPNFFPKSL